MSSTRIKGNVKQEFLHTTIKLVIDLSGTKFDPMFQTASGDGAHLAAEPGMTNAQCKTLVSPQRFDLACLIESISDTRPGGANRDVRDVILVDGSKEKGSDKIVEVKLSYFINTNPTKMEAAFLDAITKANGTERAISMFGIQGKPTDDGYIFSPSKDFFVIEASGTKANDLIATHQEVARIPETGRVRLESTFTPQERKDWTLEHGIQIFSIHLQDLLHPTDLPEIDETSTVWQINWAEVRFPEYGSDGITTKVGNRIWFSTSIRDLAGVHHNIWMNEHSALKLARVANKDEFIKAWENGDQLFPQMAAVKIQRAVKPIEPQLAADPQALFGGKGNDVHVNYVIVDAQDQPLEEPPTKATLPLVKMVLQNAHDPNSIVPAGLDQIETSPTYTFEVSYKTPGITEAIVVPCQKVLALIRSQSKSTAETLGDGFKLTTSGVKCMLYSGDSHATDKTYTVTSVCTIDNLVSYKLDPTRQSTSQCALVKITNMVNDTFVVEGVQLLSENDAQIAAKSMRSLMNLVMHLGKRDLKRTIPWNSSGPSPLKQPKSKRLGRAPTDVELHAPSTEEQAPVMEEEAP